MGGVVIDGYFRVYFGDGGMYDGAFPAIAFIWKRTGGSDIWPRNLIIEGLDWYVE